MLVRLLYASRATNDLDDRVIDSILEESRANNLDRGITGVLCVDQTNKVFLQVLEGSRDAVNSLYRGLISDPRHTDVMLLDFAEIAERNFSSWRMGSVDLVKVNLSTILRFSEAPALDPFKMPGAAALSLIEELTNTASVGGRENR